MTLAKTEMVSMEDFKLLLTENPGMVILKFGASWCGPCKRCEQQVHQWMEHRLPQDGSVVSVIVDVDESFELYAFLKKKKMIQGIPAILMYKKGNLNYVFDDNVNTSDPAQIDAFFHRCLNVYQHEFQT